MNRIAAAIVALAIVALLGISAHFAIRPNSIRDSALSHFVENIDSTRLPYNRLIDSLEAKLIRFNDSAMDSLSDNGDGK